MTKTAKTSITSIAIVIVLIIAWLIWGATRTNPIASSTVSVSPVPETSTGAESANTADTSDAALQSDLNKVDTDINALDTDVLDANNSLNGSVAP